MSVENNGTPTRPGGVTARGFQPGQSGNPGGRPKGLAALARRAVSDGADLVDLMTAVLKGDAKTLGIRAVPLRERLLAAAWFSDRGWGKAITVVELPDEPAPLFTSEQAAAIQEMPPELKDGIRRWYQERHEQYVAERRAEAEARVRSYLPDPADGSGAPLTPASDAPPGRLPIK